MNLRRDCGGGGGGGGDDEVTVRDTRRPNTTHADTNFNVVTQTQGSWVPSPKYGCLEEEQVLWIDKLRQSPVFAD
jgi:hypothetical protein